MQKHSVLRKINLLLSILLGAFFIFSAYTKTSPNLNYFEFTLSSQLHFSPLLSSLAARIFVGLEAALGILLIFGLTGSRKWIPKSSLILLIVFSVHLVLLFLSQGNDVNCGCMGDLIPMSPLASLLKNAGLIIVNLLVIRFYGNSGGRKYDKISISIIIIACVLPFFIFPLGNEKRLDIQQVYIVNPLISADLKLEEGKHIIAFLSLGCGHCKQAAADMEKMYEANPQIPFHLFFQKLGNEVDEMHAFKAFQEESGKINIPNSFLDRHQFIDILQEQGLNSVPAIFWIKDDVIFRNTSAHELNQKEIEMWLRK